MFYPDVSAILNQKSNNIQVQLFVKKNDNEGADYYYMGEMSPVECSATEIKIADENENMLPVVNIQFSMKTPVSQNIYNYLEA